MEFALSAQQRDLRSMLRDVLGDNARSADVRAAIDDPQGDRFTPLLAVQLELAGIAVPTRFGGSGGSAVELAVLFEELGAALVPGPFFSTVGLAGSVLLSTEEGAVRNRLLQQLASGELRAALAWRSPAAGDLLTPIGPASRDGSSWRVSGRAEAVVDGADADLLLVLADSDEGPVLLAVAGRQEGSRATPLTTLDLTRPMASVWLADVQAELIAPPGSAAAALSRGLDLARVALAAEQVGGAQRCLAATVDYVRLRHQFGRPVGSFQAVKHKAADMLVQVELARSAAYYAASRLTQDPPPREVSMVVSVASAYCSDAYLNVAAASIQLHGGIGFTWEHDGHLHYRRARADQLLLGTPQWHRDRLADLIRSTMDKEHVA